MTSPLELSDLDVLIERAAAEVREPRSAAARHLIELHRRGSREVFERAIALCASSLEGERLLGVLILRELGGPKRPFAREALPRLLDVLAHEASARVVRWTISAIGYQYEPTCARRAEVLPALAVRAKHADALVRFAVAAALPAIVDAESPEREGIDLLIELTRDEHADTRYYALAALIDDLDLRADFAVQRALADRTTDDDVQIRRAVQRVREGGTWAEQ